MSLKKCNSNELYIELVSITILNMLPIIWYHLYINIIILRKMTRYNKILCFSGYNVISRFPLGNNLYKYNTC